MKLIYLTKQQVMAMQEVLIRKYGGMSGLRDEGLLESALAQPRQTAFGEALYSDVYSKAAAYCFSLSENQPFIDGNKRIAAAVMGTFMILNGYTMKASSKEFYEIIMKLANKQLSRSDLSLWLQKNSKRLKKK
ncbi:MAG: Death-on-curing family protein [uncultured bacterium]|nr:MAG: Death-on-curing family protein [uncultured bacterium]